MHTLLLLRHAKSDRSIPVNDHDRPLNHRGAKDAPKMAKRLKKHAYKPDIIISSDALRAKITAEVFAEVLKSPLIFKNDLYDTQENTVLDLIRMTDEKVKNLMLVGHNPTWELLAEYLSGENIVMPTCSAVQIAFECPWKALEKGSGKVILFDYPKNEK